MTLIPSGRSLHVLGSIIPAIWTLKELDLTNSVAKTGHRTLYNDKIHPAINVRGYNVMDLRCINKRFQTTNSIYIVGLVGMVRGVTKCNMQRNDHLYRQSKIAPIVEVIEVNALRRNGHVMKREYDYVMKVALSLKLTRLRGRPGIRWINNIGSHLEGKRLRGKPGLRWINNISSQLEGKRPRGRPGLRWIDNINSHLEEKDREEGPGYGRSTTSVATWRERDREEGPGYGRSTTSVATWRERDREEGPGYGRSTTSVATWRERDREEGPGYGRSTTSAATWRNINSADLKSAFKRGKTKSSFDRIKLK